MRGMGKKQMNAIEKTKVLIVEDNSIYRSSVQELLKEVHISEENIAVASNLSESVEILHNQIFDIILLDLSLPDSQGMDTLDSVVKLAPESAVIVLTGINDKNLAFEAVKRGAQDFLHKGEFSIHVLLKTIKFAIKHKESQEIIKKEHYRAELYLDLLGHDIDNRNQAVISFLELLLLDKDLKNKQKKFINKAIEQAYGVSDLVNNVQILSNLKLNKFKVVKADLSSLLKDTVEKITLENPGRTIKINWTLPKEDSNIITNELLAEAFNHILSNAIKFDRNNTVEIDIICEETENGNFWKVQFMDRGPGVSDHFKEKIFQRLETRDDSIQGAGLGLAIVNEVMKKCGGLVFIEDRIPNNYRKGSNFVLLIPKRCA